MQHPWLIIELLSLISELFIKTLFSIAPKSLMLKNFKQLRANRFLNALLTEVAFRCHYSSLSLKYVA